MRKESQRMGIKQSLINMAGCILARYIIRYCDDGLVITRRSGNKQIIKVYSTQAYRNIIKPGIRMETDSVYREYRINHAFKRYVYRYCRSRGITVNEALQHKLVKETAQQYMEEKKGDEGDNERNPSNNNGHG